MFDYLQNYLSTVHTSALLMLLGICLGILAVYYAITVIAWWKIFKKAGEPGWKAIIPFYSCHTIFKICWKPAFFWLMLVLTVAGSVMTGFKLSLCGFESVIYIIGYALVLLALYIDVLHSFKLSNAFGHGTGFALGLVFLPTIFCLILAFGKSKYVGSTDNKI
ncbi:MAG: DUF5684 domain-containing protein [Ruminococcus sp.]